MINKTIHYHFREYDSTVVTNDVVKRIYFDTDSTVHQSTTNQLKLQLTDMLSWISEHMVLPTVESAALKDWAFSTELTDKDGNKLPSMPTRTRIPPKWVEHITNTKNIYRNQRTGDVRHTKPCPIGVLGGLVNNLKTQRELTQPQLAALNTLFKSTDDPVFDYLFPQHWIRYEFVQAPAQRVEDNLAAIFGV